jgi:hypothetical protein
MRVRSQIDLPDGGLANPCALSFSPAAILALPRAAAARRSAAAGPAGPAGAGPRPEAGGGGATPMTGSVMVASLPQTAEVVAAGGPEQGAAAAAGSGGLSGTWQWRIPEGVKRPAGNDTFAFMTVCSQTSLDSRFPNP